MIAFDQDVAATAGYMDADAMLQHEQQAQTVVANAQFYRIKGIRNSFYYTPAPDVAAQRKEQLLQERINQLAVLMDKQAAEAAAKGISVTLPRSLSVDIATFVGEIVKNSLFERIGFDISDDGSLVFSTCSQDGRTVNYIDFSWDDEEQTTQVMWSQLIDRKVDSHIGGYFAYVFKQFVAKQLV